MNILFWIIIGYISGWLTSKAVHSPTNIEMYTKIGISILGGLVGGLLVVLISSKGIRHFNLISLVGAYLGSVSFIWIYKYLNHINI